MNTWNIAVAKSGFSELVNGAREEPQIITRRNRPVAVVLDISEYEKLGLKKTKAPGIRNLIEELRLIQKEEKIVIEIPERADREVGILS